MLPLYKCIEIIALIPYLLDSSSDSWPLVGIMFLVQENAWCRFSSSLVARIALQSPHGYFETSVKQTKNLYQSRVLTQIIQMYMHVIAFIRFVKLGIMQLFWYLIFLEFHVTFGSVISICGLFRDTHFCHWCKSWKMSPTTT